MVLPGAAWDVVSPQRPLRYWRLIELDEPRAEALTATRIRIDERIVSFLKGLNVMDERLAPVVRPVAAELPLSLPATHERAVAEIILAMTEEGGGERPPVIELVGVDPAVRRGLAASAAQRLGRELYEVTPERVPPSSRELCDLTRLWERETLLLPVLLYADIGGNLARGRRRDRRAVRAGARSRAGGLPRAAAAAIPPPARRRRPSSHRRGAAGAVAGAAGRRRGSGVAARLRVRPQPAGDRGRGAPGGAFRRGLRRPVGGVPRPDPAAPGHARAPRRAGGALGRPRAARR